MEMDTILTKKINFYATVNQIKNQAVLVGIGLFFFSVFICFHSLCSRRSIKHRSGIFYAERQRGYAFRRYS